MAGRIAILASAAWLAWASAAMAAAEPWLEAGQASAANAKEVLRLRLPRLDFQKLPLERVLATLGDLEPRCRLVPLWEVLREAGVGPETPVTLNLRDTTVREALYAVLDGAAAKEPLDFYVQGSDVIVTTRADGDKRFARIMLGEARTFALGLERAIALAKRLTEARSAPFADPAAVAALTRDLRETAEPLLPDVDYKAWRLKELDDDLSDRHGPTSARRRAVARYLDALDGVLDWLLVPGVFSAPARPSAGRRAIAFRRTEGEPPARLQARAAALPAGPAPGLTWAVTGDRLIAHGAGTAWLVLQTDAPAGDVEVRADLTVRGAARLLAIFLDVAGRDGRFEHGTWCYLYLSEVPNRFTVGHDGAPNGQNQTTHVPALRAGRARGVRLGRGADRFTATVGERRSIATACPRLPAGARLRQVAIQAAVADGSLTLDHLRITCPQE